MTLQEFSDYFTEPPAEKPLVYVRLRNTSGNPIYVTKPGDALATPLLPGGVLMVEADVVHHAPIARWLDVGVLTLVRDEP